MEQNITYKDIEALVDGALDIEQKIEIEKALEDDVHLRKFRDSLQEQKDLLKEWWRYSET
jgi:anti-sigma factor RsiW